MYKYLTDALLRRAVPCARVLAVSYLKRLIVLLTASYCSVLFTAHIVNKRLLGRLDEFVLHN